MREAWVWTFALAGALSLLACDDDESETSGAGGQGAQAGSGGTGGIQQLSVSGTVVDFSAGAPVASGATVTVSGLNPPPTVSVTGADFQITGVAQFSVFHILAGAPPDYVSTYNVATTIDDMSLSGVEAAVVSVADETALATEFAVTPAPGTGTLIARAVDDNGAPLAGIDAGAFLLNDASPASGPFFLDAANAPDAALTATSPSGWVVFYDVPAGLASITAAAGSGYTMQAADSPTAANVITLAEVVVSDGEPVIPTDVSFSGDVVPIFARRGCEVCHSGNSIGADLGDLALNGGDNKIYTELTTETSPNHGVTRVDLAEPTASLILTLPGPEDPPDEHPNVTFASSADPDYLILLGWITEGALQN